MTKNNSRYHNNRYRKIPTCLMTAAAILALLSGCAVDRLKELDVVRDLMQLDQEDALAEMQADQEIPSWAEPLNTESADDLPAAEDAVTPDLTAAETSADTGIENSPEWENAASTGPTQPDPIASTQEQMELTDIRMTPEELAKEDEEKRQSIGLTEERIAEIEKENRGNYYFDHLSESGQRLYAEVYHITDVRGEKIKVSTMDNGALDLAYYSMLSDHPEIFQVDGYVYTRYTVNDELVKLGFTARYVYDKAETAARRQQMELIIGNILAGAPKDNDQYNKAKYVYDYLVEHTDYVVDAPDNQNICSVFLTGRSVCQGYAEAAQLLLNRLGVKTTVISGTVAFGDRPASRHTWNLTNVNGNDYYLDVTWGDSSFRKEEEDAEVVRRINYDYLLDTSADLAITHSPDTIVEVPECTHLEDNYYVRDGAYFTDVDETQLKTLFDKAYAEGREILTIKCADAAVFDAMSDALVTNTQVFRYMQNSGGTATYAHSALQRTLTFRL